MIEKNLKQKFIKSLSIFSMLVLLVMIISTSKVSAYAFSDIKIKSSILIDADTGNVLFENNSNEKVPTASIVKLMTLYIALSEIENGNINESDIITVSEKASGMGGSQIFLETGSQHRLDSLLKGIIISSANDASVAVAEYISGDTDQFVKRMNQTAKELNMKNTNYTNTNGLPSPEQYSTASDVAIIMSNVTNFDLYKNYAQIKLDEYVHPDGRVTQLSNTNKLLKTYPADITAKTGSTAEAGYCIAVNAQKNNINFIAVVLSAESSKDRFDYISELLDYGFAGYEKQTILTNDDFENITISHKYTNTKIPVHIEREYSELIKKGESVDITYNILLPKNISKVKENEEVGIVEIIKNNEVIDTIKIYSNITKNEASIIDIARKIIKN